MQKRVVLLLILGLAACAGQPSTAEPTPTSIRPATTPAATPTADPSQLLFIEFFGIY